MNAGTRFLVAASWLEISEIRGVQVQTGKRLLRLAASQRVGPPSRQFLSESYDVSRRKYVPRVIL